MPPSAFDVWPIPLTEALALAFAQPMFTAILANLFLNETQRYQTIAAKLATFVGIVIVLWPNFAESRLAALLPLGAALGMSILVIANRAGAHARAARW